VVKQLFFVSKVNIGVIIEALLIASGKKKMINRNTKPAQISEIVDSKPAGMAGPVHALRRWD
jgi:hypothetical protein